MGNDMHIIAGITIFFVVLGAILPFIQAEFGTEITDNDVNALTNNINPGEIENTTSALKVVGSIFLMFFWTFGALPWWLDLVFIVFRTMLALIIARNIWVGGGG